MLFVDLCIYLLEGRVGGRMIFDTVSLNSGMRATREDESDDDNEGQCA